MPTSLNVQIRKVLLGVMLAGIVLFLCLGAGGSSVSRAQEAATPAPNPYYTVNTITLADGTVVEEAIINGPSSPPPGFEVGRQAVSLPEPDRAAGINVLSGVSAFKWVLGCSAVSGAMIAGYYDRIGWPNLYIGPTNGGVMPLTDSSWPTWSDGYETYPSNPLVASRNGVDGRTTRGSIEDYWVKYYSSAADPYITNGWTQHTWGSAIGDYMKTSQSAFDNTDGSTAFYNYISSASPLTCSDMEGYGISQEDGTYGRKLFYEARGYAVTDCYNQNTDNVITGSFSFAQFKAEIDAGHPVMLNLEGHTIVGVGYDDSSNLVYLHDTWDYSTHSMTWGGSYSDMALQSVSIVNFQGPLVFTSTVDTAVITKTGPYTLTYQAVLANPSGITVTNPAFTYTLDSALTLISVKASPGIGVVSGDTVPQCTVSSGFPCYVILSDDSTVVLPAGSVIMPGGTNYPVCPAPPGFSFCTVTLPGGVIVALPVGTVVAPGSAIFPESCDVSGGDDECTVLLPGGAVGWQADAIGPARTVTMTLVVTGTALWPYQVTTRFDAFDGAAMRTPLNLSTRISVTAPVAVTASGPTVAKPGDVITYTITFSNASNLPVYNVWVTDTLPAGVAPLTGASTSRFVSMMSSATVLEYLLPARVTMQNGTLINWVDITALSLQLDPIVGRSATWNTVVAGKIYWPIIRR